jgi:hypothetical protein
VGSTDIKVNFLDSNLRNGFEIGTVALSPRKNYTNMVYATRYLEAFQCDPSNNSRAPSPPRAAARKVLAKNSQTYGRYVVGKTQEARKKKRNIKQHEAPNDNGGNK